MSVLQMWADRFANKTNRAITRTNDGKDSVVEHNGNKPSALMAWEMIKFCS
eukprot:m.606842 g.606842  ORF g.606842 m.606842 type:complete len:51 (+) comp22474_c0_seq10:2195-2347(+)